MPYLITGQGAVGNPPSPVITPAQNPISINAFESVSSTVNITNLLGTTPIVSPGTFSLALSGGNTWNLTSSALASGATATIVADNLYSSGSSQAITVNVAAGVNSQPFIGGWNFTIGDGAASEVFSAIPGVIELGGLGKENPLIRTTTFDSTGETYTAGIADGKEFSISCNFLAGNLIQQYIIAQCEAGASGNMAFSVTDGTTTVTMAFNAIYQSWEQAPSFEDRNTISFNFKVSGGISRGYS